MKTTTGLLFIVLSVFLQNVSALDEADYEYVPPDKKQSVSDTTELCSAIPPITGEINTMVIASYAEIAQKCLGDTPVQTTVSISSGGGDLNASISAFEFIRTAKHPELFTTRAVGQVASAAVLLFLAGHEREITCNSYLMIHNHQHEFPEQTRFTIQDHFGFIREWEALAQVHVNLIARATKLQPAAVSGMLEKTTFFNAQEAVKYGLATKIIGNCE